MGFFNRNKKVEKNDIEERSFFGDVMGFNSTSSYVTSNSMRLSTVFAATNIISNSVAVLPINIYSVDSDGFKKNELKHNLNYLLNRQPSKNKSKYNFFKDIITSVILNGNGFGYINRDKNGKVLEIKYLNPNKVTISYNEKNDNLVYWVTGYNKPIESVNMLHFMVNTVNQIEGVSVISYAVDTLKSASDSEKHASNFFKSGGAIKGYLSPNNSLVVSKENKTAAKSAWDRSFGSGTDNTIPILPPNLDYHTVTVNSKDAQLLESRQYSTIEICRFFNISPVKVFDLTHSSYSSLEQTALDFLETTIKPYLYMVENELNRKLFLPSEQLTLSVEFDTTSMLNTDKQSIANYYKTLFTSGILTINEIRKALNYNNIEFGDENFLQVNITTVDKIVNGQTSDTQQQIQEKTNDDTNL